MEGFLCVREDVTRAGGGGNPVISMRLWLVDTGLSWGKERGGVQISYVVDTYRAIWSGGGRGKKEERGSVGG